MNLAKKTFSVIELSTTISELDKRKDVGMKCVHMDINEPEQKHMKQIVLVGGRTLTKIVETYFRDEDRFDDGRFL